MPSVYQSVRANQLEQKLPRQHGLWMTLTLVPTQVLKERLALTSFNDGKHLVHGWGGDPVVALPEVLRMAVGQVGIVPFDAEPLKRQHILRQSPRATEPGVEVVDLLDGKHVRFSPGAPGFAFRS